MERGYEDAYRQFIEPFLGASGERVPQLGRRSDSTISPIHRSHGSRSPGQPASDTADD